jgi:UDP-N-acetylglucosamine 2-epimerase
MGTVARKIVKETMKFIGNENEYNRMAKAMNFYLNGKTSERIIKIISNKMR